MALCRTAKQVGDLMGLSVKALRLYEEHGLISPGRTSAGWRAYGEAEVQKLYKVKALKSIGFKLSEIAQMMSGQIELADILEAQIDALKEADKKLQHSLQVMTLARQRLDNGQPLSTDDFIHLTQEITKMSEFEWTEAHEKLAQRNYSQAQMDAITKHKISPEFQAEVEQVWNAIIADAERLRHGPADSPEAKIFAQRWIDATKMFNQGDEELNQATANWYEDGFSNPETAKEMPFSKEVWAFAQKAIAASQAGES